MDTVLPGVLLALSLASAVYALHCLAEHLLATTLVYAVAAAALAAVAAKVVADRL
jgi:hypothetical protein